MFELVLTVCLLAAPERCHDETPPFAPPISISECMMRGEDYAQRWLADHPGWRLKKFRCRPPGLEEREA